MTFNATRWNEAAFSISESLCRLIELFERNEDVTLHHGSILADLKAIRQGYEQLRAVAGPVDTDDELSFASIKRDMEHG